jgi:uncharacterized protein YjgD (DUF1641 family)
MARAIRVVETPETPGGAPSDGDLARSVEQDRESVARFLELVRALDESGVLRIVRDFSAANEDLIRVGVEWLGRPGTRRAVQNIRILLETLEKIDPARLERLIREVRDAIDRGASVGPPGPALGAFGLLRQLGDPDTNRGLRVLLAILKDFGVESK